MRKRMPASPDATLFASSSAVVDASILFNFIMIRQLENLARSFQVLLITPLVYGEVKNRKQRKLVDELVKKGLIEYTEPDVHEEYLATSMAHRAYGKEVSDADKEACVVARSRGYLLLVQDEPMRKIATKGLKMDASKILDTVDCIKRLVLSGDITEFEGKEMLERINKDRLPRKPLQWDGRE